MVDFVTLSLVKKFAKCVIMQLKTSFIFYVFVLHTKILKKICIHHIIIYPMILLIYPMTKNLFICKQPIRNLIKYVTLAWNLRKSKLFY